MFWRASWLEQPPRVESGGRPLLLKKPPGLEVEIVLGFWARFSSQAVILLELRSAITSEYLDRPRDSVNVGLKDRPCRILRVAPSVRNIWRMGGFYCVAQ